jgi:hypothetical protein
LNQLVLLLGWLISCSLLLAQQAFADRILFVPTGEKLRLGELKVSGVFSTDSSRQVELRLGAGVTRELEFSLSHFSAKNQSSRQSFSASYTFIDAIPEFSPAISVGIEDALNKSDRGRSLYLALSTTSYLDSVFPLSIPLQVTLGTGTGELSGVFGGVRLPLADEFLILGEWDRSGARIGAELRPIPYVRIGYFSGLKGNFWTAGASVRF